MKSTPMMTAKVFLRKPLSKILRKTPLVKDIFSYYHFHTQVRKSLSDCKTVLDIGCGVYSYRDPDTGEKNFHSTGIDLYQESINESQERGIHDVYKKMNALDIDTTFGENAFDAVIALDLLEHLEKEDGHKLLEKMEYVAKKKVIIFTPNGFLPQGERYGNPHQEHLSGWTADEMKGLGYKVIGFGGWKWLRPINFNIRFKPEWFWWIISDVSQFFVRDIPAKSFCILCIKNK
ncbi:MAG: hypothetical protein RI935_776 [Candidatus Parcubacteria bacterium]|jgi:SAM-dependent methyltransferase